MHKNEGAKTVFDEENWRNKNSSIMIAAFFGKILGKLQDLLKQVQKIREIKEINQINEEISYRRAEIKQNEEKSQKLNNEKSKMQRPNPPSQSRCTHDQK